MWEDYELLDSGNCQKLERFGQYSFIRPEPSAIWFPNHTNWQADAVFVGDEEKGRWKFNKPVPKRWEMKYQNIKFWVEATPFRHLGVFPEQAAQWNWMVSKKPTQVLNLFGYTGIASLVLAQNGAKVTHVDASKKTISWARDNQQLSGLEDKPIRWILDDALKFVEREARRGVKYDGILLDPPKYGRGPEGEVWKIEESLPRLLVACKSILADNAKFVSLTTYALRLSATSIGNLMQQVFGGPVTSGELTLKEKNTSRLLSTAIFARIG